MNSGFDEPVIDEWIDGSTYSGEGVREMCFFLEGVAALV